MVRWVTSKLDFATNTNFQLGMGKLRTVSHHSSGPESCVPAFLGAVILQHCLSDMHDGAKQLVIVAQYSVEQQSHFYVPWDWSMAGESVVAELQLRTHITSCIKCIYIFSL